MIGAAGGAAVVALVLSLTGADRFADAKAVFEAGQQAFDAGEFMAAAEAFEQALSMIESPVPKPDPRPAIVFSIAQSYRRLYSSEMDPRRRSLLALDRAMAAYRRYLSMAPTGSRREDAEMHLLDLEYENSKPDIADRRIEHEAERRPTRIMVTSKTPGALASIGNTESSTVPLVRRVDPGKHIVRVSRQGYYPVEVEAEAVPGTLAVVPIDLDPIPAQVRITAPNDAIVSVDGRIVGVTPLRAPIELAAGRRLIMVTASGRQAFAKEIVLELGDQKNLNVDLEPTGQRQAAQYFLIGGGLVLTTAIVTGIVSLLAAGGAAGLDEIRKLPDMSLTREELELYISFRSRHNEFKAVSITTFIISGVVIGTGAVLWAFDTPSSMSSPTMSVAPLSAPRGAGASATFTF